MAKKNSKKTERQINSIGFSSKGKKTPKPAAPVAVDTKDKLTKKQVVALIAITVAALIVSGIIIGAVASSRISKNPDFMTYDLSKYITVEEEDYKGYTIDVPLDYYTDDLLTRRVNILRASKKTLNETYKGGYVKLEPLSVGDNAYIYYRGFTVDENGREVDFAGSSNFYSDEATVIEVGTGNVFIDGKLGSQFIPGFAESLIGKIPNDYTPFKKIIEGNVSAGDVIYVSYTVMGENRNDSVSGERIDLSLPYINEKYGDGFVEFFTGGTVGEETVAAKPIGEKLTDKKIVRFEGDTTDTVYSDIKIEFATRCESDPLTIKVRFPANYSEESLRGVEAYFDVYIDFAEIYDVPEFDDKFITESLKVSESDLSAYSGATLAEKYKAKLEKEINDEIEETNHTLLEEAMFEHILARVEVKTLPSVPVNEYYEGCIRGLESAYENYKSVYSDIDAYARAVYGFGSGTSYEDYFEDEAKRAITEKLVFYYIIREENFIPSDSEFKEIREQLYNDILNYYLELHEEEFSKLEGEEYEKELGVLKAEIDDYYGDAYFEENVYYYYGTRKMLALCSQTK